MAIEPQVRNAEIIKAQRKSTTNLTAYDLYLRALGTSYERDENALDDALKYLEQATALDRRFSSAYGLIGWLCWNAAWNYWMSHHDSQVRGLEAAMRAIEFGGEDAEALARGGFILGAMGRRPEEGLVHAERALSLNPNSQIALRMIAHLCRMLGQHSKTLEYIERLMRLNPKDPQMLSTYILIGAAHLYERRNEEALAWAKKALILRPNNIYAAQIRVSAGAMLGEPREHLIDSFQSSLPGVPLPSQKAVLANLDVTRNVDRDLMVEVMRRLGLPE